MPDLAATGFAGKLLRLGLGFEFVFRLSLDLEFALGFALVDLALLECVFDSLAACVSGTCRIGPARKASKVRNKIDFFNFSPL